MSADIILLFECGIPKQLHIKIFLRPGTKADAVSVVLRNA
jgi:hypothetical protein